MAERMFGQESEMAFTALGPGLARVDQGMALSRLMDLARSRLPHLPGRNGTGLFLANGARFYIDCGKPEMTTPEVLTPTDLCRYARAGDAILASLAEGLVASGAGVRQVILSRCNVSYGLRKTTWACHESYSHRADLASLPEQLIPHLASRIIYTGAGGFNNTSSGLEFMVSPRVAHLTCESSGESQRNRGIFHTKNEPLNGAGYHRLHVLCGENVCSETSLWLRFATTALVVAAIEAGARPGDAVRLLQPLAAMRRFACDTTLGATAATIDGRNLRAIDIQRHCLAKVESLLGSPHLPAWAPQACRAWRQILDRLEQGPGGVERTLDWAIKLALFRKQAAKRGVDWDSLPRLGAALAAATRASASAADLDQFTLSLLDEREVLASGASAPAPEPGRRRGRDSEPPPASTLRQELFELDTRFSQLDGQGVFAALDRAGVLEHHVPGVDRIEHAMAYPPDAGRARLRGEAVRQLAGKPNCECDWSGVWDFPQRRLLDLSDPFHDTLAWRDFAPAEAVAASGGLDSAYARYARHALDDALRKYDAGRYDAAYESLCAAEPRLHRALTEIWRDFHRYKAWIQARRGFVESAASLDALARLYPIDLHQVVDYVCVYRFQGLSPAPEIDAWMQRGLEMIERSPNAPANAAAALWGHCAYKRRCDGQAAEAMAAIREARREDRFRQAHPRLQARLLCEQAEVHRVLRQPDEAERLLEQAYRQQRDAGYEGDLADFALTGQAKLAAASDPGRAVALLGEALTIQRRLQHVMGMVRTELLIARLTAGRGSIFTAVRTAGLHRRVARWRLERSALVRCGRLAKILENWSAWTGGETLADEQDFFWRL